MIVTKLTRRKRNGYLFCFLCLTSYALIAQLIGSRYGLPYIYNPDEWVLVQPALHILEEKTLNPGFFAFPGSVIIYPLAAIFACTTLLYYLYLSVITGDVSSFEEFIKLVGKDRGFNPAAFHFSGRLFTVCFSILTLFIIYNFVRKRFGYLSAFLSVVCLMCSTLYFKFSHLVRPDIVASFFIVLSLIFLVKYFEKNRRRNFILACIFAGFSVSAKYTSGVIVLPLLLTALYMDIHQRRNCHADLSTPKSFFHRFRVFAYIRDSVLLRTHVVQACLFTGLAFLVVSPYVFIDYETSLKNFLYEANSNRPGVSRLPGFQNHIWYLNAIISGLGGYFFFAVSCLGLVRIYLKKKVKYWIFFSFPIFYFLVIGFGHLRWARWIIPVLPFMSISFGIGVVYFMSLVKHWFHKKSSLLIIRCFLLVVAAFLCLGFKTNLHHVRLLLKEDTRTQAKKWIEENIEDGAVIVIEHNGPQLWVRPEKSYTLINRRYKLIPSKSLAYYRKKQVDYFVFSSSKYELFKEDSGKYALFLSQKNEIESECTLVKVFSPNENLGPSIKIYELR